jgi:hypothetical protein
MAAQNKPIPASDPDHVLEDWEWRILNGLDEDGRVPPAPSPDERPIIDPYKIRQEVKHQREQRRRRGVFAR